MNQNQIASSLINNLLQSLQNSFNSSNPNSNPNSNVEYNFSLQEPMAQAPAPTTIQPPTQTTPTQTTSASTISTQTQTSPSIPNTSVSRAINNRRRESGVNGNNRSNTINRQMNHHLNQNRIHRRNLNVSRNNPMIFSNYDLYDQNPININIDLADLQQTSGPININLSHSASNR